MGRIFRINLLIFLAVWFGVIVPGHQRGAIKLPGAEQAENCCRLTRDGATPDKTPAPRQDPGRHCAICYIAGLLEQPTTIDLPAIELRPLGELAVAESADLLSAESDHVFQGRAPPSVSL